jgi:hypothetical protein
MNRDQSLKIGDAFKYLRENCSPTPKRNARPLFSIFVCLVFTISSGIVSFAGDHGETHLSAGFLYSITHMSPVVYFILLIIFILSLINLYYQGLLTGSGKYRLARSQVNDNGPPLPKAVETGRVFNDNMAPNRSRGQKDTDLAAKDNKESRYLHNNDMSYTKTPPMPKGGLASHAGADRKAPPKNSFSPMGLQARVHHRIRLDKARLDFGARRFAAAYTEEQTLETAETWAASLAAMSGRLFTRPPEGMAMSPGPVLDKKNLNFAGNFPINKKGGALMPPKKTTQTKKTSRKKAEPSKAATESRIPESVEPEWDSQTQENALSVASKTDLSARISRIDSLIEAAQHGELNGRVPEIRREHEARWGKLLEEDISLREQILTLKQKENTLLKMIRDQVADNVMETAEVAGNSGLVKTPKA